MSQEIRPLLILKNILMLSVLFFLFSCAPQKSGWQGTVEVVEGVTVVKNPKEPLYPELQIIFEEDLTIGVKDGDENYMFGNQVFLNADEEGHIYVTDGDRNTVRKYASDGKFLQSIGRPGQGPGEFQDISEVRFDIEGNIYLNDNKHQRLSFLSREGKYIRGIKFPSLFERVVINSQGFYIARYIENLELGKGKKWDYVYGLFDNEFNLREEFLRLPQGADIKSKSSEDYLAEIFADSLSRTAYAPAVNYVLDENDRIYFGYPDKYEIKVYSSDGKLKTWIQRDFEPAEISQKHKDYFVQNQSDRFPSKMGTLDSSLRKKVFSLIKYPKYLPVYERFALMENGWIFVVVESANNGGKRTLVDIFSKDGEYLARFETDIPTDGLCFNNGKAYTVATSDDYKFIKRYNFRILGDKGG